MEDYRTLAGVACGEYEEKKSRFLAKAAPVAGEEDALAFLNAVRAEHRLARHNVYAYLLRQGNRERYSDDGEPPKTAGAPVLEVLRHAGLQDVILVVTRYFGGTLLGTGGLVRAYTAAATDALAKAQVVTVRSLVQLAVTVPYAQYEAVAQAVQRQGGKLLEPGFEAAVTLRWQMPAGTQGPLLEQLQTITRGQAVVEASAPFYGPF